MALRGLAMSDTLPLSRSTACELTDTARPLVGHRLRGPSKLTGIGLPSGYRMCSPRDRGVTGKCLAMPLRPGNAGSNTFIDHKEVLAVAIRQVPSRFRRKILIRVDGAGASHELIKHLLSLLSARREMLFTCGWMITADEEAIRQVPVGAWKPGTGQDGAAKEDKDVAEITGLMSRAGNWPEGLRWIPRRVKPSGQHLRNLTAYEKETGSKYSITCTNIPDTGIAGVPGSHQLQYIDTVHREHAVVETGGIRTANSMGLRNLPYVDVAGQPRLGHHGEHRRRPGRLDPPPRPLRRRGPARSRPGHPPFWHIPARLARHARQRILKISPDWPWKEAFLTCWQRLCAPASTRLTSANHHGNAKGGPSRRRRSRFAPGHAGRHRTTAPATQTDTTPETTARTQSVTGRQEP
jgi:hypothetical protein